MLLNLMEFTTQVAWGLRSRQFVIVSIIFLKIDIILKKNLIKL